MKEQATKLEELQHIEDIVTGLEPFVADLRDLDENIWKNLEKFTDGYRRAKEIISDENRKLKLGIIGQVKAGKSSFLNELLFNGEDILPKASTPMTAALTVLSHGEGFAAELTYYDQNDWKVIQEEHDKAIRVLQDSKITYSKRRNENENLKLHMPDIESESDEQLFGRFSNELGIAEKSSYELVKAAAKIQGLDELLGQSKRYQYNSLTELQLALPEFIGVKGQVTPLVKSCRLELNLVALQDIDLVDTPGMNDPIISRGMKTREYLKECDAVFLLSSATQFLDMSDLELVRNYLPGEAISTIVLIASKFDSALISESRKYQGDLNKTKAEIQTVLEFETTRKVKESVMNAAEGSILHRLRDIKPLLFSSYMADFSRKLKAGRQNEVTTNHTYSRLGKSFPVTTFDAELLDALSGRGGAQLQLSEVKASKEEIFRKRLSDLDHEKREQFSDYLKKLQEMTHRREKLLVEGDIDKFETQMQKLSTAIKNSREKISGVFDEKLTIIQQKVDDLIDMIEEGASKAGEIHIESHSETRTYKKEKEGFRASCARFFRVGGYETISKTETTKIADTYEAVGNLERLGRQVRTAVRKEMAGVLGSESFKKQIRIDLVKTIVAVVDKNTDHDSILIPLNKAINHLSVTKFEFNESDYVKIVSDKFRGSITGRKIDDLRDTMREAVTAMRRAIVKELNAHTKTLVQSLQSAGDSFGDTIIKQVEQEKAIIEKQLTNRKETIQRYQQMGRIIDEAIQNFELIRG